MPRHVDENDEERARRWWHNYVIIAIAVGLVLGALYGVYGPSLSDAFGSTAPAQRRMCQLTPPEYPGCSIDQIRQSEARSKRYALRHFKQGMYSTHRHVLSNVSAKWQNAIKKGYRKARQDYLASHKRYSATDLPTAQQFIYRSGCGGSFTAVTLGQWCMFGEWLGDKEHDVTDTLVKPVAKVTIDCVAPGIGGVVADMSLQAMIKNAGHVGGRHIATEALGVSWTGAKMTGAVGVSLFAGCVATKLIDDIF